MQAELKYCKIAKNKKEFRILHKEMISKIDGQYIILYNCEKSNDSKTFIINSIDTKKYFTLNKNTYASFEIYSQINFRTKEQVLDYIITYFDPDHFKKNVKEYQKGSKDNGYIYLWVKALRNYFIKEKLNVENS